MLKKLMIGMVCVAMAVYGVSACGAEGVGKAFEDAIRSRATGSVEEVTEKFRVAAGQTSDKAQKGFVLTGLAEFLMEKEEWSAAADVYQQIIREGAECNVPGACYGAAQAFLMLDDHARAKEMCRFLKATYPASGIEEFAGQMQADAPDSVHGVLAAYLAEFEGATPDMADVSQVAPAKEPSAEPVTPSEPAAQPEPAAPAEPVVSSASETEAAPAVSAQETASEALQVKEHGPAEPRVSLQLRGWQSDLTGRVESKGMDLDADDDTSIDGQTRFAMQGAWKISGKNHLRLDYMHFDHTGNLNRNVVFDNLNYGPGASVEIEARFFDLGVARLLSESETSTWRLLYGGKLSHAFMHVEQRVSGGFRSGELTQDFPIPYLGVEGNGKLSSNMALNASLKYFTIDQGETGGDMTDLDIAFLVGRDYAKAPAATEWYGLLGYRYFKLHGRTTDEVVEVSYAGPTFGVEGRF